MHAPVLGLARSTALLDIDLVRDTPDRLTGRLLSGDLDVSLISLVEYLRHRDDLVMLPDIAVGSDGPIQSCAIVTKVPLSALDCRTVALATTSPTSAQMSRLLFEQHYGVTPRYVTRPPDLEVMLDSADAAVVTGDAALAATMNRPVSPGVRAYDLGELWRRWSGLPFVLAVWAVRKETAVRQPDIVGRVIPVDTVVLCTGQEPNRSLYEELREHGLSAHLIGGADLAAELDAKRAIRQGTELGATL